jgi:cyanate lyase
MKRAELAEKILDIKREKGWTWKHITDEIGGLSPILVVGALLGQKKLPKPLPERAASLFGLSEAEKRMLNKVPTRGSPTPPANPLLNRFYELVMVNGPALKALIEEQFGDGIMSAIDFDLELDRLPHARETASGWSCPASSCRTNITAPNRACRNTGSRRTDGARRGPVRLDGVAGQRTSALGRWSIDLSLRVLRL